MAKSIMQFTKECYITGTTTQLHKHHIYRGPNRTKSEKWGCWVYLRSDWHNMAPYGVHGRDGHDLDLSLKQECQRKFEALYGHEKFVEVFGRSYL